MPTRKLTPAYQAARLRAFGKRSAPRWVRHKIWDWEFRHGNWNYLESAIDPELFDYVTRVLHGGSLLDLGCGNGIVRCSLPPGSFRRYVGIDLSAEALRRLEDRAAALPPPADGQSLIVGDFSAPDVLARARGPFDVILLHDSMYYVGDAPAFLRRLPPLLSPDGLVVVRIHDRFRYAPFVAAVHEALTVVDEAIGDDNRILIAARGRPAGDDERDEASR
ncbi:MAG TPA: class I SAM-dependent methyltransferase [Acidimicrobiia bacterium]|nr:class I SAM-dependent methyltransferase [Acidimicrobiia bacterium]